MTACIDTDVLIDYFQGAKAAAEEIARYDIVLFSRITWMEILVGAADRELQSVQEDFFRHYSIIELDEAVARTAMALRREHRLKLPDAIIWASARLNNALLVTRNTKDFPANEPTIRFPYQVRV